MEKNKQNPPPSDVRKRSRPDDSFTSDDNNDLNIHYPSFLVVETADGQPIKLSLFAIQKLLKYAVGDVKNAKKLHNGSVLIEVASRTQTDSALKMTCWVYVAVKVTPHRSLNTTEGIIRCRDLRDCDDEEI